MHVIIKNPKYILTEQMQDSCTASVKCIFAVFSILVIVVYDKMIQLFVHRIDRSLFFIHVLAK